MDAKLVDAPHAARAGEDQSAVTTWMFQANPDRYDLLAAAKKGFDDQWAMNQHRDKVAVGDVVYFFISGAAAGIYVVGSVVSPVYEADAVDEFGRHKVDIEYDATVDPYIPRATLTDAMAEPALAAYAPFRGQQRTNFILPGEVAERLGLLVADRLHPIPKSIWQKKDTSLYAVDAALKAHQQHVREALLAAVKDLAPHDFEGLIARLLDRLGYEDAVVTGKSHDMGIDVVAVLRLAGVTEVPTVIQAKRYTKGNVDGRVVRELRGALKTGQHGVIITTSGFTKDAKTEASESAKAPIALIDGPGMVDLLIAKGLGVQMRAVPLFTLDAEALLAASTATEG